MTAVDLHYTVDGPEDAPVVVLGSSIGTTSELWRPQLPGLTEQFRVVRYDHRGHGASPVPPGPYSLSDLGNDVLRLFDHLGLARAHLGGISLGGMAAMWVAANAPERVDRLTLLCTSAHLGPPELWAQRISDVRAGGMDAITDGVLGRCFTGDDATRLPEAVAEVRSMLTDTPVEGYAACCAAIQTMDLRPELPRIEAPTLVIAGLADPATPPPHAEAIAAGIRGSTLALIDGAAHLANVSHPERVTRLMLDFLGGGDV